MIFSATAVLLVILSFLQIDNYSSVLIEPPISEDNFTKFRPESSTDENIQFAYFWDHCKHQGDSKPVAPDPYLLEPKYALRTWWNHLQRIIPKDDPPTTYAGFDNVRGIFDCTLTIRLPPHDNSIGFQEMIYGSVNEIEFESAPNFERERVINVSKLDTENTLANKGLKELRAACSKALKPSKHGNSCTDIGCLVIKYANKTITTCVYENVNLIEEHHPFTRDDITIRLLLVGRFFGKDSKGETLAINYPPHYPIIQLDFTRLYVGPCFYQNQYYCETHGVCIKFPLACDKYGMYNCPRFSFTNNKNYDEPQSCGGGSNPDSIPKDPYQKDEFATKNLIYFWVILGIILGILTLLLLNYCLWRPGYLVWRCGRLRNCCKFGNCCYKCCNKLCKSESCGCCKTQGKFDTVDPAIDTWSKFAGDGFHMRENR